MAQAPGRCAHRCAWVCLGPRHGPAQSHGGAEMEATATPGLPMVVTTLVSATSRPAAAPESTRITADKGAAAAAGAAAGGGGGGGGTIGGGTPPRLEKTF